VVLHLNLKFIHFRRMDRHSSVLILLQSFLNLFENRVLQKVFGPKRDEVMGMEKIA
jgi:hypothetical protein